MEPIVKSISSTSARTICPNGDNSVIRANISRPQDGASDVPTPRNPNLLPEPEALLLRKLREPRPLLHQLHEVVAEDEVEAAVAVVAVVVAAAVGDRGGTPY